MTNDFLKDMQIYKVCNQKTEESIKKGYNVFKHYTPKIFCFVKKDDYLA